jgi:hypothetical protein
MTILEKIQPGSKVYSLGLLYTITEQRSETEWYWTRDDGSTGYFTFTPDQVEDGAFIIID